MDVLWESDIIPRAEATCGNGHPYRAITLDAIERERWRANGWIIDTRCPTCVGKREESGRRAETALRPTATSP